MVLIKCKECGNELSTQAKACPKCGAVLKKKSRWLLAIGGLFLAFLVLKEIAAIPISHQVNGPTISRAGLEVLNFDWATEQNGIRTLHGTVRNNSGTLYKYVGIYINLYNESGAQVGESVGSVSFMQPHETRQFDSIVLEGAATNAKVRDVTGLNYGS